MVKWGYCPSGRLFEASMCGVPILTDQWEGMEQFFIPGREIIPVQSTEDVIAALQLSDSELVRIAEAARERTLTEHTCDHRALQFEQMVVGLLRPSASQFYVPTAGSRHWGIIPAAGNGSRIQPLALSKELLPVGSITDDQGVERTRAVSEFIIDRMLLAGVTHLCFVISPQKSDIFEYYKDKIKDMHVSYIVQSAPFGLCDALFRAAPLIQEKDHVIVSLPDTIWFPENALGALPLGVLSFLLFPSEEPQLFDAVVFDGHGEILEIETKQATPKSHWIWGAFQMPGAVFQELFELWNARNQTDECFGSLVNAYLARGGRAIAVPAGQLYMDVGTLRGFQRAVSELKSSA
jgi:dTDP-glucose pyrophosphorylase